MKCKDRKPCRYRDVFRDAVLCGCAALLIFLAFTTGVLNRQKVWTDVQLDYAGNKKAWSIENGDAYGRVASGPYDSLPVGTYRVKWQIEGDGENRMVLSCSNDARITPSEIVIEPGTWEGEAWFEIKDPTHSFSINLDFVSGTYMQVYNIRLYTPFYSDQAFTFAAVLLALCLLLTLHLRGRLTPQNLRELLVLAAAVMFASLPCLRENSPLAYDTHFHAARILNLADGLRSGQLPVRVGGFSYNGYGAMTSVFYPDLLLYPWALLSLGGASMTYVINTLVIAVNAVTAACMFMCARRMLHDRQATLCASILYVLSVYRLEDLYARLMVGEMLAMAFLPLFLLGLYEVVLGDKRRWPVLVLGATLVFRSHMLTTLLCAGAAAVMGVICLKKIIREKRFAPIVAAMAFTLLINLNQIVPMVMSYCAGVNTSVVQFGFADAALEPSGMLNPKRHIGTALIIGVMAFVCADAAQEERRARRFLWLVLAAGMACAVLATRLVPWSHIVKLTGGLIETLQFPWRFLLMTAVCFALVGGEGLARLLEGKGMRAAVCALALGLICSVPYIGDMSPYNDLEFGQNVRTYMAYPEYQIEGTDVGDTRSRQPLLTGDVTLTAYEKDGTRVTAQVSAQGDAQIALPMFGFPGYAAELDGERVEWTCGENNRLTIGVPAGTSGELSIRYAGKALWRVADAVSLLTAAGLCAYMIRRRRSQYKA